MVTSPSSYFRLLALMLLGSHLAGWPACLSGVSDDPLGSACTSATPVRDHDGCCPPGATIATDADCAARCGDDTCQETESCANCAEDCGACCGNGKLDPGERCDTGIAGGQPGACPTPLDCDDDRSCTADRLEGDACAAGCSHPRITQPAAADGCCPPGCAELDSGCDDDCTSTCAPERHRCPEGCCPWTHELIAPDGPRKYATAKGRDGATRVLLGSGNQAFLAVRGPAGWDLQLAFEEVALCGPMDLAVADDGFFHAVYYVWESGKVAELHYGWEAAEGRWERQIVDDRALQSHSRPSLALDRTGIPHLAYANDSTLSPNELRYATRRGESWVRTAVDAGGDNRSDTSMVLDEAGRPCVAYAEQVLAAITSDLRVACFDGAEWKTELPAGSSGVLSYSNLQRTADGNLHVAFSGYGVRVCHAVRRSGVWEIEVVRTGIEAAFDVNLVIDAAGMPRLAYITWDDFMQDHKAIYAERGADGAWVEYLAYQTPGLDHLTLELDPAGRPEIFFQSGPTIALQVVRW